MYEDFLCGILKYAHTISFVKLFERAFCLPKRLKIREIGLKIVLSLTDFEKTNYFAALMFDEHILPYSSRGGSQMFRKALAPAGTYAPYTKNLHICRYKSCMGRYVPLRGAVVAKACRPK